MPTSELFTFMFGRSQVKLFSRCELATFPSSKRFRHHAFEFEISARLDLPALTGVEPFAFIAGRTRQSLRRLLEASILACGISRGCAPLNPQRILPPSPMKAGLRPPLLPILNGRFSSNSSGRAGFRPPSYHVNLTGGISPACSRNQSE